MRCTCNWISNTRKISINDGLKPEEINFPDKNGRRLFWYINCYRKTDQMCVLFYKIQITLLWRHNDQGGVSDHQLQDCLLSRLFRRRSKKTSKIRVTGLCVGNSPETGEFRAQMVSNAEYASIWWRHHVVGIRWSVFQITIFHEWDGRLTRNEKGFESIGC